MTSPRALLASGVVAFLAMPALAAEPLTLTLQAGDSVASVIWRHAREVRAHVPSRGAFQHKSPEALARKLVQDNLATIPHGVHPGNRVYVFADGHVEVRAGVADAPTAFASAAQRATLASVAPDLVHARLKAMHSSLPLRSFTIGGEGKTVTVDGVTYTAGSGIRFVEREGHFHVVSRSFDIPVWPFADAELVFPRTPYFSERARRIEAKEKPDDAFAHMIMEGQLLVHDDHYHLTRRFDDPAWQKLLAMSRSDSSYAELQRKVAIAGLVVFLQEHLELDPSMYARDLARIKLRMERFARAIDAGMAGPQAAFVLEHAAALDIGGKLLTIGSQQLIAGDGLKFSFCEHHVHVLGEHGVDVAIPAPTEGAPWRVPANLFVVQDSKNRVNRRALPADIERLLIQKKILAHEHAYHVTRYFEKRVTQLIEATIADKTLPLATRVKLEVDLEAVWAQPLPIHSEAALRAGLARAKKLLAGLRARIPK